MATWRPLIHAWLVLRKTGKTANDAGDDLRIEYRLLSGIYGTGPECFLRGIDVERGLDMPITNRDQQELDQLPLNTAPNTRA